MKMQGAAREKGDLTHTPKYRAGEKGVEGGSKTREGAAMQLETVAALKHGSTTATARKDVGHDVSALGHFCALSHSPTRMTKISQE